MASITLTPSEQEIQSFLSQYQKALSPSKNPYIRFFLRFPQATVSIYTSGKVLLQGQAAELSTTLVSLAIKFNKKTVDKIFL